MKYSDLIITESMINGTIDDVRKIDPNTKEYKEMIYRDVIFIDKEKQYGGYIELYHSKESTDDCKIASVAIEVHPNARHTGLSDKLVKKAIASMKNLKIDRIEWYCKKKNKPSVDLAMRCGFKIDDKLSNKDWWTLYYGKEVSK